MRAIDDLSSRFSPSSATSTSRKATSSRAKTTRVSSTLATVIARVPRALRPFGCERNGRVRARPEWSGQSVSRPETPASVALRALSRILGARPSPFCPGFGPPSGFCHLVPTAVSYLFIFRFIAAYRHCSSCERRHCRRLWRPNPLLPPCPRRGYHSAFIGSA